MPDSIAREDTFKGLWKLACINLFIKATQIALLPLVPDMSLIPLSPPAASAGDVKYTPGLNTQGQGGTKPQGDKAAAVDILKCRLPVARASAKLAACQARALASVGWRCERASFSRAACSGGGVCARPAEVSKGSSESRGLHLLPKDC